MDQTRVWLRPSTNNPGSPEPNAPVDRHSTSPASRLASINQMPDGAITRWSRLPRVVGTLRSCNATASTSSVSRRRVSRRSPSTPLTEAVVDDGSSASSFMTRPNTLGPRPASIPWSAFAVRRRYSRSVDAWAVVRSIVVGGGKGSSLRTGSQITQTIELEYRSHQALDRAGTVAEQRGARVVVAQCQQLQTHSVASAPAGSTLRWRRPFRCSIHHSIRRAIRLSIHPFSPLGRRRRNPDAPIDVKWSLR